MDFDEKTLSSEKIYEGKIISLEKLIVSLPGGSSSVREIVRHSGASAVLPVDDDGYVYLVRQYRKPVEKVSVEIPAGRMEPGESPVDCAVRELSEETGLSAGKYEHLASIITTPAFCDEEIHLFLATDLEKGSPHEDEDEFLSCEKVHIDKAVDLIMSGSIFDSKTIAALLIFKNRYASSFGR